MGLGAAVAALGVIIIVWPASAAASTAGYVIALAGITWGAFGFGRGLRNLVRQFRAAEPAAEPIDLPAARALDRPGGAETSADANPATPPWNPVSGRELALVAVLGLAILLPGLSSFTLIDPWEGHYGEVARRMLEDDDWVKLQWQNEPYFRSKPGLTFWLMAASMQLHGVATDGGFSGEMVASDLPIWALRLPFALFGVLGLTLVWWMLAQLVSRKVAWFSFGALATIPFYGLVARQAITDIPMVATTAGALSCFVLAVHAGDRPLPRYGRWLNGYHLFLAGLGGFVAVQLARIGYDFVRDPSLGAGIRLGFPGLPLHPAPLATLPFAIGFVGYGFVRWKVWPVEHARQLYMLWAYFLVALSVLAKGPAGVMVVVAACALYLVLTGAWRLVPRLALIDGLIITGLAAAPWHIAMVLKDGRPWIAEYFGHHWFKRAGVGVHGETGTFNFFVQQLGIGMWPWIALVPGAVAAAVGRGIARTRSDQVRLAATIWAVSGFCAFALVQTKFHHYLLPAIPGFAILIGFWLDDLCRANSPRAGLFLAAGIVPVLFIASDVVSEPKQLIELFVYRYDRPWPAGAAYDADISGVVTALAAMAAATLVVAAVPRTRRIGLGGFAAVALGSCLWILNGYMAVAAPHWGQGALHETYYRERTIYGVDITYYSLRDLAEDWGTGARHYLVDSYLPDTLEVGAPMTVHIEVPTVGTYDLAGKVSRLGEHRFWIAVPERETAKLADLVRRGRDAAPAKQRRWLQVNADRLLAWQLNWRGENFWQSGEIWGRTPDTQTVFVSTDNKQFLEYLNEPSRRGRRFYLITEAARADGLRNIVPTETAKQTVEKIDTSCNKFTLLRFTL
jgi:4-amino-4-deoxy-L-arabinose transferase-like glycosyltransferase